MPKVRRYHTPHPGLRRARGLRGRGPVYAARAHMPSMAAEHQIGCRAVPSPRRRRSRTPRPHFVPRPRPPHPRPPITARETCHEMMLVAENGERTARYVKRIGSQYHAYQVSSHTTKFLLGRWFRGIENRKHGRERNVMVDRDPPVVQYAVCQEYRIKCQKGTAGVRLLQRMGGEGKWQQQALGEAPNALVYSVARYGWQVWRACNSESIHKAYGAAATAQQ